MAAMAFLKSNNPADGHGGAAPVCSRHRHSGSDGWSWDGVGRPGKTPKRRLPLYRLLLLLLHWRLRVLRRQTAGWRSLLSARRTHSNHECQCGGQRDLDDSCSKENVPSEKKWNHDDSPVQVVNEIADLNGCSTRRFLRDQILLRGP
jgi:hypothetical protein